jgi:predicted nucleotidyltransferase
MSTELLPIDDLERQFPELRLLILHGSRARGDAHPASDWDFAYRASTRLDELGLRAALTTALGTDAVDLADLDRSSGVLRYAAARDGQKILENPVGEFERFATSALRFWLDAEPVLRKAHSAVLKNLG